MDLNMGAATHVGKVRKLNEDAFLAAGSLALVADGMGGHARGDVASDLIVQQFRNLTQRSQIEPSEIRLALADANEAILADTARDPSRMGMGTTVCGLALVPYNGIPHWLAFNIGDSRLYRLNAPVPMQLTTDHSEVAELIAAGQISEQEALEHPLRHVITRSLGTMPPPDADVWIFPPHAGDVFLICSDGLTNELDNKTIAELASQAGSCSEAAAALVTAAVEIGGHDNITAVVVSVADDNDFPTMTHEATTPRKQVWKQL